jgi:hypothetical protein
MRAKGKRDGREIGVIDQLGGLLLAPTSAAKSTWRA